MPMMCSGAFSASWTRITRGIKFRWWATPTLKAWALKTCSKASKKLTIITVKIYPQPRLNRRFCADLAMPFNSISLRRIRRPVAQVRQDRRPEQPSRLVPGRSSSCATTRTPRYASRPTRITSAASRPADPLILAVTTDNNVRLQKLKANECQIALYPQAR